MHTLEFGFEKMSLVQQNQKLATELQSKHHGRTLALSWRWNLQVHYSMSSKSSINISGSKENNGVFEKSFRWEINIHRLQSWPTLLNPDHIYLLWFLTAKLLLHDGHGDFCSIHPCTWTGHKSSSSQHGLLQISHGDHPLAYTHSHSCCSGCDFQWSFTKVNLTKCNFPLTVS